jgi:RHS repeat-associated protein
MKSIILFVATLLIVTGIAASATAQPAGARVVTSPSARAAALFNAGPLGRMVQLDASGPHSILGPTSRIASAPRLIANAATPPSACNPQAFVTGSTCNVNPGTSATLSQTIYCVPFGPQGGKVNVYVNLLSSLYGSNPADVSFSFSPEPEIEGSAGTITVTASPGAVLGESFSFEVRGTTLDNTCTPAGTDFGLGVITVDIGSNPYDKNNGCQAGQFPYQDNGGCGDPIFPGTGNVTSSALDYDGPGLLKIARFYNSSAYGWSGVGTATYPFPFPYLGVAGNGNPNTVVYPDGHGETFTSPNGGTTWATDGDTSDTLTYMSTPASNGAQWILSTADGATTQYDTNGFPLVYTARGGASLTYTHQTINGSSGPTGLIQTLTDDYGRQLVHSLNLSNYTTTVTTPDGNQYVYPVNQNVLRLSQVQYPDGSAVNFNYSTNVYISSIFPMTQLIDEKGTTYSTWTYDNYGRATSTQLAGGVASYGVAYNGVNNGVNQATITDPLGTVRTFSYQNDGFSKQMLIGTSQPCDTCGPSIASKTLGTNGQITSTQDFRGVGTTYNYNSNNLPTSITRAAGTSSAETTGVVWGAFRAPMTINQTGQTVTIGYDALGNPLTYTITDTTSGASRTWTYTWSSFGQLLTSSDPNKNVTKYSYNNLGDLTSVTDPLGHSTALQHNQDGWITQRTDPNGSVTTYGYDPRGRLTSMVVGTEHYGYGYDPTGRLTSLSLPSGYGATFGYDSAHRLTSITDVSGNRVQYTLDNAGNQVEEQRYNASNTLVYVHSKTFDSLGRLAHDIGASQQTTVYGYDGNNNLASVTDPLGNMTQYAYDSLNRQTQITTPDNNEVAIAYNGLNQVTGVTDPRRLNTSYTRDALNDLLQTTSPDAGTSTATFDAVGNTLSHTDAKGQKLLYQYDAINRMTQVKRSDTGQILASYTYDQNDSAHGSGIGHLTSMTDLSGSTNWSYDANGHVLSKTVVISGQSLTTSYSYNSTTGNVQSMTLPSGKVVGYTWTNGQVSALTLNSSALVSNIVYEPFAGPVSWTLGNGESTGRSYDQDGRITADPVESITYDAASRVTGWTQGFRSALNGTQGYGYDSLNRLTSYTGTGGPISYTYDAGSNRLTQDVNATTTTYTIDPASNRVTKQSVPGLLGPKVTSFGYDANGSTTSFGAANLTYNVQGQLGNFSAGLATGIYTYNGMGQRVEKQAGLNTIFAYDQSAHLIGEYGTTGSVNDEIVYLGDMPIAVTRPSGTYYVHADYRNAPRQIDNSSKAAVWEWDPTPFGDNQPNQQPNLLTPAFGFSLRLPGQYYDGESTLSKNLYRDYYSSIGRYAESDPIGVLGGLNTYAYTKGNPVNRVDPKGLDPLEDLYNSFEYPLSAGLPNLDAQMAQEAQEDAQEAVDTYVDLATLLATTAGPAALAEGAAALSPLACRAVASGAMKGMVALLRAGEGSPYAPEAIQAETQELRQIEFLQNELPGGDYNPVQTPPTAPPPAGGS